MWVRSLPCKVPGKRRKCCDRTNLVPENFHTLERVVKIWKMVQLVSCCCPTMRTWVQVPRTHVKDRQGVMCLWPQWWAGKDKIDSIGQSVYPTRNLQSLGPMRRPVSNTRLESNEKRPLMETSGLYTCADTCALRPTHINIHIQRDIIYITDLSHSRSQHFLLLPCNCQIQIISFSRNFASLGASF